MLEKESGHINITDYQKKNTLVAILAVVFEWMLIGLTLFFYSEFAQSWLLVLLIPFIASRQYALYSLLHEGIHYNLLNNKRANDLLARVFLALPLGLSLKRVRYNHFEHHAHLKTKNDPEHKQLDYPEFQFPMTTRKMLTVFFLDLIGFNFIKYKWNKIVKGLNLSPVQNRTLVFLFWLILCGMLLYLGFEQVFIWLWLIPLTTVYQFLNRLRLYLEHNNLLEDQVKTRSVILHPIIAFFLSPYNLGYHGAHHLYPSVPFYRIKHLHYKIKNRLGGYTEETSGIKGVFNVLNNTHAG